MQFEYQNPTRLVFGNGSLSHLDEMASQYGKRAMLMSGDRSARRNGTFERALKSLSHAGISLFECKVVEPKPGTTSVKLGTTTARKNDYDLVTALGGGRKRLSAGPYTDDGSRYSLGVERRSVVG